MAIGFISAWINPGGTLRPGSIGNVSCKHVSDGQYEVHYENIFNDAAAPQITCSSLYPNDNALVVASIESANAINTWTVFTRRASGGDLYDSGFFFLVVGQLAD
jgi:hypothetical protein